MSCPSTVTCPRCGRSKQLIVRSMVDLPEPEGPMITVLEASGIDTVMPLSTCREPKCRWTSEREIIGIFAASDI